LELEIKDAFMVPINETGDSIAIEEQVHKSLYQLYKKAHPKESVLGWFGSSNKIDDITSLIHDFYSKGADRAFPYPAVYLNVQYLTEDNKVKSPTFTTYIAAGVGKPASSAQQVGWKQAASATNSYIFTPVPNEITGTNTINRDSNVSFLNQNLDTVKENIQSILSYIERASAKNGAESDADLDILRLLSNSLLNKSPFTNLNDSFNNHNQDLIMIEYLIRAVQDQIRLSEKLSAAF
jgi:translation initiation factor 3 subunit F